MKDLQNKSVTATRSNFELAEGEKTRLLKEYATYPVSSGKTQYMRYLNGEKLSYMQMVVAKCAECNCGYEDGRRDCGVPTCPLYQAMPYKGKLTCEIQGGGESHE